MIHDALTSALELQESPKITAWRGYILCITHYWRKLNSCNIYITFWNIWKFGNNCHEFMVQIKKIKINKSLIGLITNRTEWPNGSVHFAQTPAGLTLCEHNTIPESWPFFRFRFWSFFSSILQIVEFYAYHWILWTKTKIFIYGSIYLKIKPWSSKMYLKTYICVLF